LHESIIEIAECKNGGLYLFTNSVIMKVLMSAFIWQGKVAIVTGASSGIGAITAQMLAQRGVRVTLAARRVNELEKQVQQIQAQGGKALSVPTDVTQQLQVQQLMMQTLAHWGRLDYLIANAGQYIQARIDELSLETLRRSMAVNFYAQVYCIQAVLPHFKAQGSGHIVLVTSMDAKTPVTPDAPYVAAKQAISGFGDVLRQELRGTGVGISIVYPGRVDTQMVQGMRFPAISKPIHPETVAKAILRGIERRQVSVILPPQAKLLNLAYFIHPKLSDLAARLFKLSGY
jgi:short-subunit dehydrogenase